MKTSLLGKKVNYMNLNSRQQEIYNYQKVSGLFADYWFTTIKLSDDRLGADFIAMSFSWNNFLRVQLKGKLTFDKKYVWKDLYICFEDKNNWKWYLYNHDELLKSFLSKIKNTESWKINWKYFYSKLSIDHINILKWNVLN